MIFSELPVVLGVLVICEELCAPCWSEEMLRRPLHQEIGFVLRRLDWDLA